MPTIGLESVKLPAEPTLEATPKANTLPSAAANRYPGRRFARYRESAEGPLEGCTPIRCYRCGRKIGAADDRSPGRGTLSPDCIRFRTLLLVRTAANPDTCGRLLDWPDDAPAVSPPAGGA